MKEESPNSRVTYFLIDKDYMKQNMYKILRASFQELSLYIMNCWEYCYLNWYHFNRIKTKLSGLFFFQKTFFTLHFGQIYSELVNGK